MIIKFFNVGLLDMICFYLYIDFSDMKGKIELKECIMYLYFIALLYYWELIFFIRFILKSFKSFVLVSFLLKFCFFSII